MGLLVGLAFVLVFAIFAPQAFSQYLPGVYDPYFSWGAYPAMNNAAFARTVYDERSASKRQSLAQVQQQQQAQNCFLVNQARGQEAFAAQNNRAASEAWIRANQPSQTLVYSMPAPAAMPAICPVVTCKPRKLPRSDFTGFSDGL